MALLFTKSKEPALTLAGNSTLTSSIFHKLADNVCLCCAYSTLLGVLFAYTASSETCRLSSERRMVIEAHNSVKSRAMKFGPGDQHLCRAILPQLMQKGRGWGKNNEGNKEGRKQKEKRTYNTGSQHKAAGNIVRLIRGTIRQHVNNLFTNHIYSFCEDPNNDRGLISFTIRDSPMDFINGTCWGSENYIFDLASKFKIGDIGKFLYQLNFKLRQTMQLFYVTQLHIHT